MVHLEVPTRIRQAIITHLSAATCWVEDQSGLHTGHRGATSGAGHYQVTVLSAMFEGKTRIQRHRLVYDCLGLMMKKEIHALRLTTLTPDEAGCQGFSYFSPATE